MHPATLYGDVSAENRATAPPWEKPPITILSLEMPDSTRSLIIAWTIFAAMIRSWTEHPWFGGRHLASMGSVSMSNQHVIDSPSLQVTGFRGARGVTNLHRPGRNSSRMLFQPSSVSPRPCNQTSAQSGRSRAECCRGGAPLGGERAGAADRTTACGCTGNGREIHKCRFCVVVTVIVALAPVDEGFVVVVVVVAGVARIRTDPP
mmetsp:Transcript_2553/g.7592  ORF Transcript_2553/g.7592 Transcript_2553/m.7592 type:complete len:205 (+) Transcript_2553:652-1266(+)